MVEDEESTRVIRQLRSFLGPRTPETQESVEER